MNCGNNTRASESFSADKVLSYICSSNYSQTRQFQVGKIQEYKLFPQNIYKNTKKCAIKVTSHDLSDRECI